MAVNFAFFLEIYFRRMEVERFKLQFVEFFNSTLKSKLYKFCGKDINFKLDLQAGP